MQPIPIVYEEPHFLLVNKPAALFSQAPIGIDSLQARLIAQLKARDQHPGEPFVGLPHRLDRGTSGIMLIARNQRALKRFGQQFQSRKVVKHYLAVVEGVLAVAGVPSDLGTNAAGSLDQLRRGEPQQEQRWEDYLRKIPGLPQAEIVTAEAEGAKLAVARVECLCSGPNVSVPNVSGPGQSLLRIQLETGRMHQIRLQAASRGLPVVGDASYGAKSPWSDSFTASAARPNATETLRQDAPAADRSTAAADDDAHAHPPIALHAWSLEFRHPQTAKTIRFVAPVPENWQQLSSELLACISELT